MFAHFIMIATNRPNGEHPNILLTQLQVTSRSVQTDQHIDSNHGSGQV